MVLDSGPPSYRRRRQQQRQQHPPDVFGPSLPQKRGGKEGAPCHGLQLYPFLSPSLSLESDSSSSPGQRVQTPPKAKGPQDSRPPVALCPAFQGPCGWMRRSESICAVNRRDRARGQIRSATSLPHIAKAKAEGAGSGRKSPCLLVALRPVNVEEEREKFFQAPYAYNPQFEYGEPVPETVLEKYKDASDQFIYQAIGIMNAVLEKYGTYENFEATNGGKLLSKCQIWSIIRKYMQKERCSGEVVVQLTEDLLSQAVMMVENSRPTLAINLSGARQFWLEGMLRHEIGTHYLRGVNNAHQPWHSPEGRKQHGLSPVNPTEEGLASLHSVLFRKQPFLWRAALLYYTVVQASGMSFCELFHDLERYVKDAGVRWEYCVRAKRGQVDTSRPGCFSKDQVYLDGILRILRHRQTIDFPLLVALGKVSYEDMDHLKEFGVLQKARIPHFMLDLERYMQQLNHIVATNRLTDKELELLLPD
ncbi:microtubule-associated tyrosine carboxypeptidase 1 isoform X2 [Hemicordylus capensis]|uniref:microtubule-associated tyrosine carboxypeptidase 1 isoform X2 n=1 Tax=Hemicordylus capensis TaxID=884348 RepID=UPI0023035120|nr:microtubule-associated tyrosine carboxypeptidase 1 isoform X2 [Hemicordylus capensis]